MHVCIRMFFTYADHYQQAIKSYRMRMAVGAVSYTHLRAHETLRYLVCRLLLEKKKEKKL